MGGKEQICTGKLMYTYLCAELISDGELWPAGRHGHQTVFQTREDLNGEVLDQVKFDLISKYRSSFYKSYY